MNCHDAQSRLGDYALGLLPPDEALRVKEHLDSGCFACRREIAELHEALFALVEDEPLVEPPARIKDSLLDRLEDAPTLPRPTDVLEAKNAPRAWLFLAAGIAALAVGVWAIQSEGPATPAPGQLAREAWQDQIEGTNRELGLAMTNLVSMPLPPAADRRVLSYLLLDKASGELHVWVQPQQDSEAAIANWAWLLDADGNPLGSGELITKGNRYAAVVNTAGFDETQELRLLLTHESDPTGPEAPSKPSDEVIESMTLRLK